MHLPKIKDLKFECLFPNICISLRIFCTLPVTVAQAERSFSRLARKKMILDQPWSIVRFGDFDYGM